MKNFPLSIYPRISYIHYYILGHRGGYREGGQRNQRLHKATGGVPQPHPTARGRQDADPQQGPPQLPQTNAAGAAEKRRSRCGKTAAALGQRLPDGP